MVDRGLRIVLALLFLFSPYESWGGQLSSAYDLVTAGVASATPLSVGYSENLALQTTGIGSDVYKVQVSLDDTNFEDLQTISANGILQLSGLFVSIKVVKVSGSGNTAKITLRMRGLWR